MGTRGAAGLSSRERALGAHFFEQRVGDGVTQGDQDQRKDRHRYLNAARIVGYCVDLALLKRDLAQLQRQLAAARNGRPMPRSVLDFEATGMALAGFSQRYVGDRFGRNQKTIGEKLGAARVVLERQFGHLCKAPATSLKRRKSRSIIFISGSLTIRAAVPAGVAGHMPRGFGGY